MIRSFKIIPFQCCYTRLPFPGVHFLQLYGRKLLHMAFDRVEALSVIREIGSVWLQANHPQRRRRLQRAMDVVIFAGVLGLVQICR